MQVFSSVLSDLYTAAEAHLPGEFSIEALRLLRQLLFFDDGLLGSALVPQRSLNGMEIIQTLSYGRAGDLFQDYTSVAWPTIR